MKIRSRIAAVGASTPRTRYLLVTHRRRLMASWTVGCAAPGAVGQTRQRDHRAGAATRARMLARDGELIVRRGVDASAVDGIYHASQTSKS